MAKAKRRRSTFEKAKRRSPAIAKESNRPKKLRQWSDLSMVEAMKAVQEGKMGVNRAALEFGVPRTTLKDRIAGRVVHGSKSGPKPYLNHEEEKELVEFLITCSKMGYGKTRSEVLKIVEAAMQKKGREGTVSQGWWVRFCERWPSLRLRKGDSFPVARDKVTNREVFENYFKLLKETLEKNDLMDKPAQIYNCDESGMPLEHKLPKTIALKGTKKVRQVTSGNKTQITVLGCVNATGSAIPPMVVFSGKKFNHELSKGEVPGTLYGTSESGWMDQKLFYEWFVNHFLKHAVSTRPLLLLLDGHSSHYTLDLVKVAAENDVILFCLPPHSTADSQPLDTSCFGPLKIYWSEACRQYMFSHPGRVVSKFQFSPLFAEAWGKGMTINNIVSGFRCTGVYPFNPDAILGKIAARGVSSPENEKSNDSTEDVVEETEDMEESCDEIAPSTVSHESESPLVPIFSSEELERFEKRFENGYDIFTDQRYVSWLQEYHPESAPSISDAFTSVIPLEEAHSEHTENGVEPEPMVCDGAIDPSATGPLSVCESQTLATAIVSPEIAPLTPETTISTPSEPGSASTPHAKTRIPVSTSCAKEQNVSTPPHTEVQNACSPVARRLSGTPSPPVSTMTTPVSTKSRSPLSELLVLPASSTTPKRKTDPPKAAARVLTSAQSLELLIQKELKKKEEQEEKERKKLDRERKRLEKEKEKAQRQLLRETKKAEKLQEKEAKKAEKEAEKQRKMAEKQQKKSVGGTGAAKKQYPKRKQVEKENSDPNRPSTSGDTCFACCGAYVDDVDENGEVTEDWIQCSDSECGVWSHVDCLEREARGFVCANCSSIFN